MQCLVFRAKYRSTAWSHGIPRGAPLSVEQVTSLLIYCNFSELASKLRASFVPRTRSEALPAVIRRHCPFHWLSRTLHVVVELFGAEMASAQCLYHSLDVAVPFRSTECRWNHMFSATASIEAASAFAAKRGILVQFGRCRFGGVFCLRLCALK